MIHSPRFVCYFLDVWICEMKSAASDRRPRKGQFAFDLMQDRATDTTQAADFFHQTD